MPKPKKFTVNPYVPGELRKKADLYAQRNALYKDNYKRFGPALFAIMGLTSLCSPDDYNRFALLVQMFAKITRYAAQFAEGGHDDSLDDISVYAMMLKEVDTDARRRKSDEALDMASLNFLNGVDDKKKGRGRRR